MTSIEAKFIFVVVSALNLGAADARCLNEENTAIPESTPTASFTILNDGTVIDRKRRLMWTRCLVGQTLSNNGCTGIPFVYDWKSAVGIANGLRIANHSDWRLPNPKEWLFIMEDRCSSPGLNYDLFPIALVSFSVWTGTPRAALTGAYTNPTTVTSGGEVNADFGLTSETPLLLVRDAP
jgi:hypothetical protein